MPDRNTPVQNPTWYADIRQLFTETDINHMRAQGLDLASYDTVKDNAGSIYGQVSTGNMPPPPNTWPQAWVTTLLNWMTSDYPKGAPSPARAAFGAAVAAATSATRIRKEITTLSAAELDLLKTAFFGILAKDPDDPHSYFVQSGIHWLPGPLYCQHHVPAYNPWHRAYLVGFENALRSVPGCENVTLPYWDITTPFPDALKVPPFDKYTLPKDIGGGFNAGYVTERYSYGQIQQNLAQYDVNGRIQRALSKTDWEDFHGMFAGAANDTIISAHDAGHVSIGTTMAKQEVAAYDPAFWFFHANWDRLFWAWQKQMQATTLNNLLTTVDRNRDPLSYQIFTIAALENLAPFTAKPPKLNTLAIIDSENSLDIDYEDPPTPLKAVMAPKTQRAALAAQEFTVHTDKVNVRVQGVNRLKIPGSFSVHLLKDGKTIASSAFFQPVEAEQCENCVKNAIVHFDFELPFEAVKNGKLSIWVEPFNKEFVGNHFPQKMMGSPTVDVHFLLQTE